MPVRQVIDARVLRQMPLAPILLEAEAQVRGPIRRRGIAIAVIHIDLGAA